MSQQIDIHMLTLSGIAHRCAQETELFFQRQRYDPRYCFELFRRAILDNSQRAWEMVYAQYHTLVARWVERHSAYPSSGEEVQDFVQRAYFKLWTALTAEKFEHFADLKSILRYLQMCVHSVIIDFVRMKEHEMLFPDGEVPEARSGSEGATPEQDAIRRIQREELWRYLNQRFQNEKEYSIVYGTFVLALKPRELYAQYPEMFRDVKEVYRVKENIIARLRRDNELKQLLGYA